MVAALAWAGAPVVAQPPEKQLSADVMSKCLIANATVEHENLLRTVMIDALKDDIPALNKSALTMSMGMIMLAQQSCGLTMTDLNKPEFAEAMKTVGGHLGEKIMTSAMAKIGK